MRALVLLWVLAIAAPVRPQREPLPDELPPSGEQVLGDWVTVKYTRGGEVDIRPEGTGLKFARTEVELHAKESGSTIALTYKLDVTKSPAHIDMTIKGQMVPAIRAIIKIDGDQLTLCAHEGGNGERPTSFASPPGSNISLVVLRRAPAK